MSVAAPVSSPYPSADSSQSLPPATAGGANPAGGRVDRPITPRLPQLAIDAELPRSWAFDNVLATALIDSVSMLFPAGERFFVRSVHHYLQHSEKPLPAELKAQIQGFFAQEGRHAQQHERLNRVLGLQGYDVSGFLRLYERICYHYIERVSPPALRLSATAAAEHFTAILADNFLRMTELTEKLEPNMRRLLLWHAAEEIEHKAVAYDQLMAIDDSYTLRTGVMNLALVGFYLITFGNTLYFMAQDRSLFKLKEWSTMFDVFFGKYDLARKSVLKFLEYYKPDFHPWDNENYHLAQNALAGYDAKAG